MIVKQQALALFLLFLAVFATQNKQVPVRAVLGAMWHLWHVEKFFQTIAHPHAKPVQFAR